MFCRIRPPGATGDASPSCIDVGVEGDLAVYDPNRGGERKQFRVDCIFDPLARQEAVYVEAQPLIRSVLDGGCGAGWAARRSGGSSGGAAALMSARGVLVAHSGQQLLLCRAPNHHTTTPTPTTPPGYNVCIFAYGQTGSGKTHTMSGTNVDTEMGQGINYRALNDLFSIRDARCDEVRASSGGRGQRRWLWWRLGHAVAWLNGGW